jgi:hypothetical protein
MRSFSSRAMVPTSDQIEFRRSQNWTGGSRPGDDVIGPDEWLSAFQSFLYADDVTSRGSVRMRVGRAA